MYRISRAVSPDELFFVPRPFLKEVKISRCMLPVGRVERDVGTHRYRLAGINAIHVVYMSQHANGHYVVSLPRDRCRLRELGVGPRFVRTRIRMF